MLSALRSLTAAIGLLVTISACQPATNSGVANLAPASAIETIASYPHGAFLENLNVGSDGNLLFTSYMDRSLYRWTGQGAPTRLAQLDAHPAAVLSRANDIILTAHGTPFTDGQAFTKTNQILVLDRTGRVVRRTPAPEAMFLNGMVELSASTILLADSIGGKIWSFDPEAGTLTTWFADPTLTTDPSNTTASPGVNGLKIHDGFLYISNSSRAALYRVKLAGDQPQGPVETVATPGSIDDFTFLSDGSIAAATHASKLIRIAANGTVTDIMAEGCDACTSVTSFGPDRSLIVLTTGDFLEGGTKPARVLRIASPVAR